jgi:hypothetical protein
MIVIPSNGPLMVGETIIGLVLFVILSLLDPVLWLAVALARLQEEDRNKRDLHVWQNTGI